MTPHQQIRMQVWAMFAAADLAGTMSRDPSTLRQPLLPQIVDNADKMLAKFDEKFPECGGRRACNGSCPDPIDDYGTRPFHVHKP